MTMSIRGQKLLQEFETKLTFEGMLLESFERVKTMEEYRGEQVKSTVVVIGSTGAGKSTFINASVLRRKMELRKQDLTYVIDVAGCKPGQSFRPEIGHDVFASKTIFPEAFYRVQPDAKSNKPALPPRPGSLLGRFTKGLKRKEVDSSLSHEQVVYGINEESCNKEVSGELARFCDSGGLHDAGLPKFSAAIAICTQHLIRTLPLDGFICMIAKDEITGQRGRGFKDVLSAIQRFAHVTDYTSRQKFNIKFIVSKCSNSPDEVRSTLRKMLEDVDSGNERLAADVRSGIELMLEKPLVTYDNPDSMLENVTDDFLDFSALGKQDESTLNRALASPDAIRFMYENAPWPQVLRASLKVEEAFQNSRQFNEFSRELEYCVQYLLPSVVEALDLIVADGMIGSCTFGCFGGVWPFRNSYRKKLVQSIRNAGLKVAKAGYTRQQDSPEGGPQQNPASTGDSKESFTSNQSWTAALFQRFQQMVTFGEFDKREFIRNLQLVKDVLFLDQQPVYELNNVLHELERKKKSLESVGGDGIFTTSDMDTPKFFAFKCNIIHMFETELTDEIRKREARTAGGGEDLVSIVQAAGGLSERIKCEHMKIKDILNNHRSGIKRNCLAFEKQKKMILNRLTAVQLKIAKVYAPGLGLPCTGKSIV